MALAGSKALQEHRPAMLDHPASTLDAEPAVRSARQRCVRIGCDDWSRGRAWAAGLAGEGLDTEVHAIEDRSAQAADACVLHISARPAEQLPRLRSLRAQAPHLPLLVALRDMRDLDQVLALEMGADDALDMAWDPAVVAARLRALWRRGASADGAAPAQELHFGALELLLLPREARLRGRLVPLTEGEFEVLWLLASQAGHSVSRRDILRRVRGLDDHPMDRSIDSRVYRIRAKLGDAGGSPRIRTVRNHGYAFSPTGW
jgi:two-component system response regulator RstA